MSSKPEDFTSDEVVNGGFKTEAGGKTDFFTQKVNFQVKIKISFLVSFSFPKTFKLCRATFVTTIY